MVTGPKMVAYAQLGRVRVVGQGAVDACTSASRRACRRSTTPSPRRTATRTPTRSGGSSAQLMNTYVTVERHNNELDDGRRDDPEDDGALEEVLGARQRQARQPGADVHAAAVEHAAAGARHHRRCALARRVARVALQARVPQARRREVPEDDDGDATTRRATTGRRSRTRTSTCRWSSRCCATTRAKAAAAAAAADRYRERDTTAQSQDGAAQGQAAGRAGRGAALGRVRGAVGGAAQRARRAHGRAAQAASPSTGRRRRRWCGTPTASRRCAAPARC